MATKPVWGPDSEELANDKLNQGIDYNEQLALLSGYLAQDDATTSFGTLTWGYRAGVLRNGITLTAIAAGTKTITTNATNYIEADPSDGSIDLNTTSFTAGKIPVRRIVVDSGGSVTSNVDERTWLIFSTDSAGDGSGYVSVDCSAGGTISLTAAQSQVGNIKLTGTPTADFNVATFDTTERAWGCISNNTAKVATFKTPSGTGQTIAAGDQAALQCDGTNIIPGAAGGGSVTSVGATVPTDILAVAGVPITGAGAIALSKANVAANLIMAGPASGGAAAWAPRAMVNADLPNTAVTPATVGDASHVAQVIVNQKGVLTAATAVAIAVDTAAIVTGELAVARGGTDADLSGTGGAGVVLKQKTVGAAIAPEVLAASEMPSGIDAAKLADGSVSNAEYETLDGVSSPIQTQLNAKAPLASPALTGTPTAPTAAADTNTTQIADTAFVVGQKGTGTPIVDGSATAGTSLRYSSQDHVHPTDTSRAADSAVVHNTGDETVGGEKTFSVSPIVPDSPSGAHAATNKTYVDNKFLGATIYQGTWNASTNSPTLTSGAGVNGGYYVVSTAGTTTLDGISLWAVKDWAVFNGTIWEKVASNDIPATGTITGVTKLSLDPASAGVPIAVGDNDTRVANVEHTTNKNAANGYPGLDSGSKLTGSQQVYGTGSNTACEGNDARLTDARTPTGSAGGDLTGTYPNPTLGNGTVDTAELVDEAVTDAKVATGIDASKIGAGTVSSTVFDFLAGVSSAIQTQINALIAKSIFTTKGDIIAASAANTPVRLGVGSDGTYLQASSGQVTGLEWSDLPPFTLIVEEVSLGVQAAVETLIFPDGTLTYDAMASTMEYTPSGGGASNTRSVNQVAHGLSVGNEIKCTGSDTYAKAKADSAADAEVVGTVTAVADADNFTFTGIGSFITLSSLTAAGVYFLDPSTAGAYTTTEPSTTGQISKPVFVALTTTVAMMLPYRGAVINNPPLVKSLFDYISSIGNVGTGEDDLHSSTIAANQLSTNGDKLYFESSGTFSSSATATREIKKYFAGSVIYDTGTLSVTTASYWSMTGMIIRVSSTVVRYRVCFVVDGVTLTSPASVGELTGLTLSSTNILKATGQSAGTGGGTDNDVVETMGTVIYYPSSS